jgi:tyrosine-protein phosphatase SIW14
MFNMPRLTVALSLLVVALVVAGPLLYRAERGRTYRNFRVVEHGVLYRGGQMTPTAFERVCRERGVRTVIKLREANDDKPADVAADAAEEQFCRDHGIVFHRILPKDWEADPATGKVPMEDNLRWFERAMADPAQTPRPVLVHCFAGIHRTGAMVAAYRMKFQGWTNAEAVAEFKSRGRSTTTYVGNLIPYLTHQYRPGRSQGEPAGRPDRPFGTPRGWRNWQTHQI